jgi:YbbR domain-containing protein
VVSVIGPESEIDRIEQAVTIPVELPGAATIFEDLVGVEAPSALSRVMPERVTVRARLEEIAVTREYHNVIVGVRNGSGRFETDRADVTVRGPERILNEFRPSEETVFVDLAGLAPGKHQRKIKARFPAGVEIVKTEPNTLTVEIAGK